eukprot:tig00020952_g16479.t1
MTSNSSPAAVPLRPSGSNVWASNPAIASLLSETVGSFVGGTAPANLGGADATAAEVNNARRRQLRATPAADLDLVEAIQAAEADRAVFLSKSVVAFSPDSKILAHVVVIGWSVQVSVPRSGAVVDVNKYRILSNLWSIASKRPVQTKFKSSASMAFDGKAASEINPFDVPNHTGS